MTKKVNFLDKGAYALTYKRLVALVVTWFVLCLGVFVLERGYSWYLGNSYQARQQALKLLNTRKEKTMALVEASSAGAGQPDVRELSQIFSNFPLWSVVLGNLSGSMPGQVWLTAMTTGYLAENSMMRKIEINGLGRNTSTIASFVQQLNNKPDFSNIVLSKSEKVKEDNRSSGYSFTILGEVRFGVRKWD